MLISKGSLGLYQIWMCPNVNQSLGHYMSWFISYQLSSIIDDDVLFILNGCLFSVQIFIINSNSTNMFYAKAEMLISWKDLQAEILPTYGFMG